MKKLSLFISLLMILSLTACGVPGFSGKKVKKEYFAGGELRSEFIMDDDTGQNGLLKQYGYNGNMTSSVQIHNGVKNGVEIGFDGKGRELWKLNYINGKQHGIQHAYYPNGDVMVMYTYKNGLKDGPARTYNIDGSVAQSVIYTRGKLAN